MPTTVWNPVTWAAERIGAAGKHVGNAAGTLGGDEQQELPEIRRIDYPDLRKALEKGFEDFQACRSDVAFLCILYPLIGIALAWFAFDRNLLPLVFPVMSGFAIIGPVAAVGLYQMSRVREQGGTAGWADAFAVVRSPSFGAIFVLALLLFTTFIIWLIAAHGIWSATLGPEPPASLGTFLNEVFTTGAGWTMMIVGMVVGLAFAIVALSVSVVSFPLLLDRRVGLPVAIVTSMRVAALNPGPIAAWGVIVAVSLAIGSLPVFLGLIVVLPVLGHATWHLYRAVVVPAPEA